VCSSDLSIFSNEDLPAEEFKDFLNTIDSAPHKPLEEWNGKSYMPLDDALNEKFDINESSTLT
jgi:hypothetical protein